MFTLRKASTLAGLMLMCACGSTSGNNPVGANPAQAPRSANNPVFVGYQDNQMTTAKPNVILTTMDGTVVTTLQGQGVGDERAIGAYLVMASDGSGKEWTVDAAGAIKLVAPAAAKVLTLGNVGSVFILNSTSAIVGCSFAANGDCTAEQINLTTGAVRPLLTVAMITGPAAMEIGPSLEVLDVSTDLHTVWFREVTGASDIYPQGPAGKLDIASVDLRTGTISKQALPAALLDERDLAISRDGKWVAGQEQAGTDGTNLAIRHLHVVSLVTGVDSDVQGTAPYVGGLRSPSIQFAPGGAAVLLWGGLNNGSANYGINVAPVGAVGKTLATNSGYLDRVSTVFWVDTNRLLVQSMEGTFMINADTGAVVTHTPPVPYVLTLLR